MTAQHFADENGNYVGVFIDGASPPEGCVGVTVPPTAKHKWNGTQWVEPPVNLEALTAQARNKRNTLLTASDWTQVADAPVDQAAWATYRQALRDVPSQAGFPETIDWPTVP